jgi:hypothetical protein
VTVNSLIAKQLSIPEELRKAIKQVVARTQPLPKFTYTAFRSAADTDTGVPWCTTWEAWSWHRRCAAATPAKGTEKARYPTEFGAAFDGAGKANVNVQSVTWLLLDYDKATSLEQLEAAAEQLRQLGIAFLLSESSSSRCPGKGFRWHAYLQIVPLTMPAPSTPGLDWDETVRVTAEWWRAVHAQLRAVFGALWGSSDGDSAVDHWSQPTFVPHRPMGGNSDMDRTVRWSDGRPLDVCELLGAVAHVLRAEPLTRPAIVRHGGSEASEAAMAQNGSQRNAGAAAAQGEGASSHPAVKRAVDDSSPQTEGATPNESTGSLLYQALSYFDLIGPKHDSTAYLALCPWREMHASAVEAGKQDAYSSSTLCFVRGHRAGEDGGYDCKHEGCREDGRPRSAADVLSWARRRGAPIPDRLEWASAPLPIPPPPVGSEVASSICAAFETAPEEAAAAPSDDDAEHIDYTAADSDDTPPQPIAVEITNDILEMSRGALQILARHPRVFVREGKLVELYTEKHVGQPPRPRLRPLTFPYLLAVLSCKEWAEWYTSSTRRGKEERTPTRPDRDAVKAVLAGSVFSGIRTLTDVVAVPVFRPDGTLLQRPGYDATTQLYYQPDAAYAAVSEDPTKAELERALTLLLDPLRDYRRVFKQGQEALCVAVWLSAVFTPFLRQCVDGPRPMIVVSANRAGGGKTKLVTAAALISDGRGAAMSGKMLGDDSELERILGMHIENNTQTLCFDNVPSDQVIASPVLESYITSSDYTTRRIGTSARIKSASFGMSLWATGNAVESAGDMQPRILRIEIEDTSPDPAKRVVEQTELEDYVKRERPRFVHAALTLLSGFFAAKRRHHDVKLTTPPGRFPGWSEFPRKAVVWCGLPDPALAFEKSRNNSKASGFEILVQHLINLIPPEGQFVGNLAGELFRSQNAKDSERVLALRSFDAFLASEGMEITGKRGDGSKLGKYLGRYRNDVCTVGGKQWQITVEKQASGNAVRVLDRSVAAAKV